MTAKPRIKEYLSSYCPMLMNSSNRLIPMPSKIWKKSIASSLKKGSKLEKDQIRGLRQDREERNIANKLQRRGHTRGDPRYCEGHAGFRFTRRAVKPFWRH